MELQTIVAVLFLSTVLAAERVVRVGNDLKPSASGVDVPGATFILNNAFASDGVVFAFSAFFRSDKAMRFQIWRPTLSKMDFQLIGEIKHIPSVMYSHEDVYVESKLTKKCIQVHSGDHLGIFIEQSPGAVAYTFDTSGNPKALGHTLKENQTEPHTVGDTITFDTLTFPYDFSMAAYVDTDMDHYKGILADDIAVECPKGLLIPDYINIELPTQPTSTGEPGATGATGPAGLRGLQGPQGVGITGPQGEQGEDGSQGAIGAQGKQGEVGVAGVAGPQGATGESGATGPRGEKGEHGESGPAGPAGPMVLPDDINEMIQASTQEDEGMMSSPMFTLGLGVWLIVITLVVIILIVVVIVVSRRKSQKSANDDSVESGYTDKEHLKRLDSLSPAPVERANSIYVTSHDGGEANPQWLSTLKSESESHIGNQTICDDNSSQEIQNGNHSYSSAGSQHQLVSDTASTDSSEFRKPEMVY